MNLLNVFHSLSKLCLIVIVLSISPLTLGHEKRCETAREIPLVIPCDTAIEIVASLKGLIEEYNYNNPDKLPVVISSVKSWEDGYNHVLSSHNKQQPAGIILTNSQYIKDLASKKAIISLNDFQEEIKSTCNLSKAWAEQKVSINNNIYSLPYLESILMTFCNMTLLNERLSNGKQPCDPPKTYKEFEELAKRYQEKPTAPLMLIVGQYFDLYFSSMVAQQGGRLILSNNRVNLNSEIAVQLLLRWQQWYKLKYINIAPSWVGTMNNMTHGNYPIIVFPSSGIKYITNTNEMSNYDLNVVPLPKFTSNTPISSQKDGIHFCLSKYMSQNQKDNAKAFIKFLYKHENHARISANTGYFPTTQEAYEQPQLSGTIKKNNHFAAASNQLKKHSEYRPSTSEQKKINEFLRKAIYAAVINGDNAQNALDYAQGQAEDLLNQ